MALSAPGWCATDADLTRPGAGGAATPVHVYLYLADVHSISASDQSLDGDVVLTAEWQDPRLAGRWPGVRELGLGEAWYPQLQLVNQRAVNTLLPQRLEVDPLGNVSYRQRWTGKFSVRMDLRDFPLDRQRFAVQVVSLGYPRNQVDLIPDVQGKRSGRAERLSVTNWRFGPAQMEIADFEPAPGATALAGVQLVWDGHRQLGYYVVQVILPLVMIVLMGWTAFWLPPSSIPARISAAISTMLTLIAYRFAFGNLVPQLTYLTRFDYFMLASTIFVFMVLLVVTACAYLTLDEKRAALGARIDRYSRLAFPVILAMILLFVWQI